MKHEKLTKFGRKQLVLASLVLALGAAVYLNWQFSGTDPLPVGTYEVEDESTESHLGAAQLVNNAYIETVSDDLSDSGEILTEVQTLAEARLSRQTSRDTALELLDEVLENVDSDSDAKQQAVAEATAIAQNILQETNVENLLTAKGYKETVACIGSDDCTVVIAGDFSDPDTLIIQEIVMEQTGLTADKIKIIKAN